MAIKRIILGSSSNRPNNTGFGKYINTTTFAENQGVGSKDKSPDFDNLKP